MTQKIEDLRYGWLTDKQKAQADARWDGSKPDWWFVIDADGNVVGRRRHPKTMCRFPDCTCPLDLAPGESCLMGYPVDRSYKR